MRRTYRLSTGFAGALLLLAACSSPSTTSGDGGSTGPGGGSSCSATNPCASGERCADGACFPTVCGGRACAGEGVCIASMCVDSACVGVTCSSGEACAGGACLPTGCNGTSCGTGEVCVANTCVEAVCVPVQCGAEQVCSGGFCVTTEDAGTMDAGVMDAGVVDAGTPDAGTPDAGTPDAGHDAGPVDAGPPDACSISGSTYKANVSNPSNSCQTCQPSESTSMWSNADGVPCTASGGDICQSGMCVKGCEIDGGVYAPAASPADNSCLVCDPAQSTSSFAPGNTNQSCNDNAGFCETGSCLPGCVIQGEFMAVGTLDSANDCQACQPATSTSMYSPESNGTTCTGSGTADSWCQQGTCINQTPASSPHSFAASGVVTGPDGNLYVIGGDPWGGAETYVDYYNYLSNSWSSAPALNTATFGCAAAVGPDGLIYELGGTSDGANGTNSVESYSPGAESWQGVRPMPTPRVYPGAAVGPDGLIYVVGGSSTFAPGGLGGLNGGPTLAGAPMDTVEAYNTTTGSWSTIASLPTARWGMAVVTGPDGLIYAIGGYDGTNPSKVVEAYDTSSGSWSEITAMPTARDLLTASVGPDSQIYAIGGTKDCDNGMNVVESYDPIGGSWVAAVVLPTARMALGSAVLGDGRIYAVEGSEATDYCGQVGAGSNIVEAYSVTSFRWWSSASN